MADRPSLSEEEITDLARIIFAEASSQYRKAPEAMEGIGWAIMNRIGDREFGTTFAEVLVPKQLHGMTNKQWEKAGDPSKLDGADKDAFLRATAIARGLADGTLRDPTDGSQFFYSTTHEDDPAPGKFFPSALEAGTLEKSRRFGNFQFVRKRPR